MAAAPAILEHVDLPTLFDPATCVRKGLCPVMAIKGEDRTAVQSHSVYFEQHGTGKEKLVFIVGLNTSSFAWVDQVRHFAKTHTVLVLDNRGVGNSDSPRGPYSTSEMADDVLVLLEYVGWNNNSSRDLHLIGASMGGCICQMLAQRIPHRILSLTLVVTKPGSAGFFANMTPWKGLTTIMALSFAKDDTKKISLVLDVIYPATWLDAKSEKDNSKTNREVAGAELQHSMGVQREQPLAGALGQTAAAFGHNVTANQLAEISHTIPKILVLTGDVDDLTKPVNSEYMARNMPEAEYQVWQGYGHGLTGQDPKRFNETLERVIKEGRERASQAPWV